MKRQHYGALGKTANCQVAASTVLLDDQLAWPLTFELNVPQDRATDAARRTKAGIPETVRFREKWRMALAHIGGILKADVTLTSVLQRLLLREHGIPVRRSVGFEPPRFTVVVSIAGLDDSLAEGRLADVFPGFPPRR